MPKQQQSLERQGTEERLAMEKAIKERRIEIYRKQIEAGRKITYTNIM